MAQNTITFQLATHYLSRIALRLEYLFKTIHEACHESHEVIHRYALKNLIEIIELIEKPELKSRFLKELIRIEHVLKRQIELQNPTLFDHLETQIHILNHVPGQFSNTIHQDEFLKNLRQIHHPNTKECEFSSPQLVLWFDSNARMRQETISQWVNQLRDLDDTVTIYLSLLREATEYITIRTYNGFYQHSITPQNVINLILLSINKSFGIAPKLQLGHHSLTIRLYDMLTNQEIRDKTVDMEIAFSHI